MARAYWHAENWGGPRPGAGRPLQGARTQKISLTLPEDLLGRLDQEAYHQQLTRSAVITHYLHRGLHPKEEKSQPGETPLIRPPTGWSLLVPWPPLAEKRGAPWGENPFARKWTAQRQPLTRASTEKTQS